MTNAMDTQIRSCQQPRCWQLFLTLLFCGLSTIMAHGETRSFSLIYGQQSTTVEVETEFLQSTEHVSLFSILQPINGTVRIAGASVQIQLGSRTAQGTLNRTTVEAGGDLMGLESPFQRSGSNAMIALQDLGPFLSKAFQVTLRENTRVSIRNLDENKNTAITAEAPQPSMDRVVAAQVEVVPWSQIDTIVIDPGHGGTDPGISAGDELIEKNLTLQIALELRKQLKTQGNFKIYMTRDGDTLVPLQERINRCNQYKNAVLISLHAGGSTSARAHGIEIFYSVKPQSPARNRLGVAGGGSNTAFSPMNQALAESLAASLGDSTGTSTRGVQAVPLRLFRDARLPGVLIELGFLSNPAERTRLKSAAYQERLARGIVQGLQSTLRKEAS